MTQSPPITETTAIAALHAHLTTATVTADEVLDLALSCPVPGPRATARRITTALTRLREHLAAVVVEAGRQAETDAPAVSPTSAPALAGQTAPKAPQENAEETPAPARRPRRSAPGGPRKPRAAKRSTGSSSGLNADNVNDRGLLAQIHLITDAEAAAARRLCTRYGRTSDETAELIDMLGIGAQEAIA
ncbi:hypothetical protein [Planomonospora sp. ID82291]|uniref:hypothetical protein n=1 Tax=Planomonospora sp. ID82291 TaxID=2738136 RepID=UPI0018C3C250|nr:hypothetical protein [Planomonospora sp. ID82291]MBG0819083.1 hypothetical protein [Planomonospora sp. ID82291]